MTTRRKSAADMSAKTVKLALPSWAKSEMRVPVGGPLDRPMAKAATSTSGSASSRPKDQAVRRRPS